MALRTELRRVALCASVSLITACQGRIGAPTAELPREPVVTLPAASPSPRATPPGPTATPPPVDPCAGSTIVLAELPLRRLSSEQYTATVRDLLGDPGFTPVLDDDAEIITERGVRQLRDAAEQATARRAIWTRAVFPCDPSGARDAACAAQLISDFGARAFRRPLSAAEQAGLMDVYRATEAAMSFADSLEVVVEVMLQSPQLLYIRTATARAHQGATCSTTGAWRRVSAIFCGARCPMTRCLTPQPPADSPSPVVSAPRPSGCSATRARRVRSSASCGAG